MQRHGRNVHKKDPFTKPTPLVSGPGTLQHPFTCIVAGCAQSGKMVWVKTLLENAQQTIRPLLNVLSGAMDNGNPCI